ncbi:MAG: uroporphyrinogen-III C-methyltransferase [Candidatus Omnitrophica bacterium]|nr:uroporphyrinogen-III C-methyltransferase [Candidatus Omnitrophota bacterium]
MKKNRPKGRVILVGAGPGDPGLITWKGLEILRDAEVLVYDWLANPELLKAAPSAEKIYVGKKGGAKYKSQKEINQIVLQSVRQGKVVVRLKGGDPFIFGRGGEEASYLADHHIPFEVIPGVSAGVGVPAYAGIPLTDRRFASQVTFITGHEDPTKNKSEVDWEKLARVGGTLVSFMGAKNLPDIIKKLIRAGKPSRTPVAVIEWGTFPHQRVVVGTLKDIVKKTRKTKVGSPALTIIGNVVSLRKKLSWFGKRPLQGKTILVTRARAQSSELVRKLSERGAEVLEFPTLEILPPSHPEQMDREIQNLSKYDWLVFTSINGVHSFFERMKKLGKDARIFRNIKVAAIGDVTAKALEEKGILADLTPKEFTSMALFEQLKKRGEISGKKYLLARADIAPSDLKQALEKEGAEVVDIEAYQTRRPKGEESKLLGWFRNQKIDYITFTSSSTVRNFFESIPPTFRKKIQSEFVSIGPVTSATLKEYGFKPDREAEVHTIQGLVEALK